MALTGQAKTDYQREYMRRRRSNKGVTISIEPVRPVIPSVRPKEQARSNLSANQQAYIQFKAEQDGQA